MELSIFNESLEQYLEAIKPTVTQRKNMDEKVEDMTSVILQGYPESDVSPQGSFATDTQVKPLTDHQNSGNGGEYDVDLAVERVWSGAKAALENTEVLLTDSGEYDPGSIDGTKQKCVRVNFPEDSTGVSFHLDIVPTRLYGSRQVPIRDDDEWTASDSKNFAVWFNQQANDKPSLREIVIILKRLRDLVGLTDDVKSILLITLVVSNFESGDSLMDELLGVLDGLEQGFAVHPTVRNPVNQNEVLSFDYEKLKDFFTELSRNLTSAAIEQDTSKLIEIFGPGFTFEPQSSSAGLAQTTGLAAKPRAYGC